MDRLSHAIEFAAKLIDRRLTTSPQYVYVLGCDGFVKIGIARNIKQRIANMQIGSPHTIEFLGMFPTLRPRDEERWLHKEFEQFNTLGEWFSLPALRLDKLLRRACYHYRDLE